jgi:hypothetical protein
MSQTPNLQWWQTPTPPTVPVAGVALDPTDGRVSFAALAAFTMVLVLAPQEYLPVLGTLRIAFAVGAVAIGTFLFGGWRSPRGVPWPVEYTLALLLVACAVLSVPISLWPGGSFSVLTDQFLKSVMVFLLLGRVVCSTRRLRWLIWTLTLAGMAPALTALVNYMTGQVVRGRVAGYGGGMTANANDLADTLALFLPLTAALALTAARRWQRIGAWAIVATFAAAVVVTFSRQGFLALVLEAGLLLQALIRRRALAGATVIVAAGALAMAIAPEGYGARLATMAGGDALADASIAIRWRDTVAAAGYLVAHPLTGAGIGQDALLLNEIRGQHWAQVHNVFLVYGLDLGLIGLALFTALVITSLHAALQVERLSASRASEELAALAAGVRISLAAFVIIAFSSPSAYYFHFYYVAGLSVALKTIAARELAS